MSFTDEQNDLRKYLLGELSDDERAALGARLLDDDELFEQAAAAEENLFQDYADDALDAATRERFERVYPDSPENRRRLEFARALRRVLAETSPAPVADAAEKSGFFDRLRAFFAAPLPVFGAVLLICGLGGFVIWKYYAASAADPLVADGRWQKNERPAAGRIAGFVYAPAAEGTRGGDRRDDPDVAAAKAAALRAVQQNESAANLRALALVYLAEDDFERSLAALEKALAKEPNDARLHNDLGVVLLEQARRRQIGNAEPLTRAAEAVEKAIALDPNLTEAYFNRALAAELLGLPEQARAAWENYLSRDSSSRWADEARERLGRLEAAPPNAKSAAELLREFLDARAADDPESAWRLLSQHKELVNGKLIPQQLAFLILDADRAGRADEAERMRAALDFAGRLEAERSGDLFWPEMAAFYAALPPARAAPLVRARELYGEGLAAAQRPDYRAALEKFAAAQTLYRAAGSEPEAAVAEFLIAYLLNRTARIAESSARLGALADLCARRRYKWLGTQAALWLGINEVTADHVSRGLERFDAAFRTAAETDDFYSRQKLLTLRAESYTLVGRRDAAFEAVTEGLQLARAPQAGRRETWRLLNAGTGLLYRLRRPHAALLFGREAWLLARRLGESTFEYTSATDLGLIYAALGDFERGAEFIERGRQISEGFPDPDYRAKCLAHTNMLSGHLRRRQGDHTGAADFYRRAAEFYDSSEFRMFSYAAHRGLLLSHSANGDADAFGRELPPIMRLFDKYRAEIDSEEDRNSFFDNEQDVYDIAADFAFRQNDHRAAFELSEQSRSRSLLALQNSPVSSPRDRSPIRLSGAAAAPLTLAEIQAQMPENAQLLQYAVLGERTLVFLVTRRRVLVEPLEMPAGRLEEMVSEYGALIARRTTDERLERLSAELFELLVRPVRAELDAAHELFIVPDKFLFRLPFETLSGGRRLIEDFRIVYAPSANVFLFCTKKAARWADADGERLLSVGNPTFAADEFEGRLGPLPSAEAEAAEIAPFYAAPVVLTGGAATKESFRRHLPRADVVHFAGHYVVDERAPMLSALVLAGADKASASLANYEIFGAGLAGTRLIVLSACRTGFEKYYRGEGMVGGARTFLAAGVPLVVASRWDADSEAARELMVRFHALRKTERLAAAEALRRSQLEMLAGEKYRAPYYWAAFAAIGGRTKF